MPDDFYDRDILIWAEQQAGLLRRLATGARVNDAIDWPRLIEEVEDLGRAALHACESRLRQAMLYLLKLHAGADQPAAHWRVETLGFLADAAGRFSPSVRKRIALPALYSRARQQATTALADELTPPAACSWRLDSLIADPGNHDSLFAALARA